MEADVSTSVSVLTEAELGHSPGRDSDRLAVLLIHGIGDQQPMNTLRDFLKGLFRDAMAPNAHLFSKPDRVSSVMEMRRMSADKSVTGVSTDFYELYWAHLMQGTTLGHVGDWITVMLLRPWREVPRRLRPLWITAWTFTLGALLFAFVQLWTSRPGTVVAGAGLLGCGVVGRALRCAMAVIVARRRRGALSPARAREHRHSPGDSVRRTRCAQEASRGTSSPIRPDRDRRTHV